MYGLTVVIMDPKKKNKLSIGGHSIGTYTEMYSTKYKANKMHSLAMATCILKAYPELHNVILRSKYKIDIADCIIQTVVFMSNP